MTFRIVELDNYSGEKTKVYSILFDGETDTLYEQFLRENEDKYLQELKNLDSRLEVMGKETGLIAESFKDGAGKFGENLCTFKDKPRANLRLFFIHFSMITIVLGGGGMKSKKSRTTQHEHELNVRNRLLGAISIALQKALNNGSLTINDDGTFGSTTNLYYNI